MLEKELELRFSWLYPHLKDMGSKLRLLHKNRNFSVREKVDGSIVTDIDEEMSAIWQNLLGKTFPGEYVVSEEDTSTHHFPPKQSVIWYVDPIDGTSKFVDRSPNYYVLIGIAIDGMPGFGLLYQPERNCVLYGNPFIKTRIYTSQSKYRVIGNVGTWKKSLPLIVKGASPNVRECIESVTQLPVRRSSNATHNIIAPLSGNSSGFISFRKSAFWDLLAPAAIMQSSGFQTFAFRDGDPAFYNDGDVYCSQFFCLPPDTPDEIVPYLKNS